MSRKTLGGVGESLCHPSSAFKYCVDPQHDFMILYAGGHIFVGYIFFLGWDTFFFLKGSGRKEGREGRKEGRREGGKEGRREGGKDGRK